MFEDGAPNGIAVPQHKHQVRFLPGLVSNTPAFAGVAAPFTPPPCSCSYRPHCCRSPLIFLTECSAAANANARTNTIEREEEEDIYRSATFIRIRSLPYTYSFVCRSSSILHSARQSYLFVDRTADCCSPLFHPFLPALLWLRRICCNNNRR